MPQGMDQPYPVHSWMLKQTADRRRYSVMTHQAIIHRRFSLHQSNRRLCTKQRESADRRDVAPRL